MKKRSVLETSLEKLNKNGANFFAELELKREGAVYSKDQKGYVLGEKVYRCRASGDYWVLDDVL